MKPELSIIIPCYNCEKTLIEAVESCYTQGLNMDEFEIIMVDDSSTDHTRAVMDDLSKIYNNISIYYHENNLGGGSTRNTAISKTNSQIIFCLDGDDVLPADTLPRMLKFMNVNDCDGVLFEESRLFKDTHHKKIQIVKNRISDRQIKLSDVISGKNGFLTRVNFLYKKSAYEISGGYTTKHGFDTQSFGLRFLNKGLKVYVCPNTYYFHRLSSNSYFNREYAGGKFSINAYLTYEEIFHLLSKTTKEEILEYDISRNNTSLNNLDQFIERKFEIIGPDKFFINDYENFLTNKGEDELFELAKNSDSITGLVSAGVYCIKREKYSDAKLFFEKALFKMPESKIIQMNLMRANTYGNNIGRTEDDIFSKFIVKRNFAQIFINKIQSKIKKCLK